MFERLLGWLVGNIAESLYGGMNFDLEEEDFE